MADEIDGPATSYYDREFQVHAVKLLPGQYHAAEGEALMVTVLGSCVSACLWDPERRIGGMNHFMLPGSEESRGSVASVSARLGIYSMELLINRMLKLGAERSRLVAKVFGGGNVLEGLEALNIGDQNGAFVLEFLREEGIRIAAQDLYDIYPRKVYFFAGNGRVLVKKLGTLRNDTLRRRELAYLEKLQVGSAGDIQIFSPQA